MPRFPDGVDTSAPNIARMYDYYLGGKDNFEAERVHEIYAQAFERDGAVSASPVGWRVLARRLGPIDGA